MLSVYVLAGQMALHCHERDMVVVLPQLQECVGAYLERDVCPEIGDGGGWVRSNKHTLLTSCRVV